MKKHAIPVYELNCSYNDSVEDIFEAIRDSDLPLGLKHTLLELEKWVEDSQESPMDSIAILAVEYLAATCGDCGIRLFTDAPKPSFIPFKIKKSKTLFLSL